MIFDMCVLQVKWFSMSPLVSRLQGVLLHVLRAQGPATRLNAFAHVIWSVQITNDTLAGFGEPSVYGLDSSHHGKFQTADECCAKCRRTPAVRTTQLRCYMCMHCLKRVRLSVNGVLRSLILG